MTETIMPKEEMDEIIILGKLSNTLVRLELKSAFLGDESAKYLAPNGDLYFKWDRNTFKKSCYELFMVNGRYGTAGFDVQTMVLTEHKLYD